MSDTTGIRCNYRRWKKEIKKEKENNYHVSSYIS